VQVFEFTSDSTRKVHTLTAHTESCRTLKFLGAGGELILSGSADKSILATDASTGQAMARLENAHAVGVNALITLDEKNIASGTHKMQRIQCWGSTVSAPLQPR
jgi:WD40 repeat protein